MDKLKRELRYLLGTKHLGITLEAEVKLLGLDAMLTLHMVCIETASPILALLYRSDEDQCLLSL